MDGDPSWELVTEEVSKHQEILSLAGLEEAFKSRRAT